ncbi:MAG TPA: methyltransferase domain-containing protein [Patescibacteria group bacterium]
MINLPFIPYFQTTRYKVQTMIELSQVKPGEKVADLGSGDGRIVIAMAQKGAQAFGYELNSELIKKSENEINKLHLENNAHIIQKDFWHEDLSIYSIITVYPMPDIMLNLEQKLLKELNIGTRVLLNYYPFPTWKEVTKKDNIYLYIK